jgi:NAD+ kinase
MVQSLDDALGGRCQAERRMLLAAQILADGRPIDALALNDVVVAKRETGRMVDVRTWVNGAYVNTHVGDGFIIATPTGSTAYALSCGGPIMHPSLDAIVLVPVCPHTLSDRPIVVPAGSVVEIELADRFESRAQVVCDGIVLCDLDPGVRLRIERARVSATLLHPPGHDYYRILRSKLHWGRGTREGQPPGA